MLFEILGLMLLFTVCAGALIGVGVFIDAVWQRQKRASATRWAIKEAQRKARRR